MYISLCNSNLKWCSAYLNLKLEVYMTFGRSYTSDKCNVDGVNQSNWVIVKHFIFI